MTCNISDISYHLPQLMTLADCATRSVQIVIHRRAISFTLSTSTTTLHYSAVLPSSRTFRMRPRWRTRTGRLAIVDRRTLGHRANALRGEELRPSEITPLSRRRCCSVMDVNAQLGPPLPPPPARRQQILIALVSISRLVNRVSALGHLG